VQCIGLVSSQGQSIFSSNSDSTLHKHPFKHSLRMCSLFEMSIEERCSGPGLALEEATVLTLESFLRPDGSSLGPGFIGMGRTAIVLREGETALKIPKLRNLASVPTSQHEETSFCNKMNREKLRNELEVLQRLESHTGIIKWINTSRGGISLPYLRRGNLCSYVRHADK
jgi:hypothetical protein